MHGQFFAPLATLAIFTVTPASLPIRAPVSAVAAGSSGAVALTADEVRVMDGTGFPIGHLLRPAGRAPAPPRRPPRAGGAFAAAAGVLGDGDFNDPHDPDSEVEDAQNVLVEDDAPIHRRARAMPEASGVALAVAAGSAWVGREDGLWRLSFAGGVERTALPAAGRVRTIASSADGQVVVAALDGAIVRSDDGGSNFERLPPAPGGVVRLAVTGGGLVYALTGQGLWRLQPEGPGETILRGVEDVTACGGDALALVERRLAVLGGDVRSRAVAGDRVEARPLHERPGQNGLVQEGPLQAGPGQVGPGPAGPAVPAGAERVACSPDGAVWVAYGAALWVSEDRGRSWSARDDVTTASPIASVAVTGTALWVASGSGLAVVPLRDDARAVQRTAPGGAVQWGDGGEARTPRWKWWLSAVPRIDLGFATARSTTRRDVRAFVMLSFTFDPRRDVRAERQLAADARAAERRQAARHRPAPDVPARDPIAIEERDATARLLD